jgi:hypothetical protein
VKLKKGQYGVVRATAEEYAGRFGYYDNDSDDGQHALVYFGEPFTTADVLIRHELLEPVDLTLIQVEKFKKENPELARLLGID